MAPMTLKPTQIEMLTLIQKLAPKTGGIIIFVPFEECTRAAPSFGGLSCTVGTPNAMQLTAACADLLAQARRMADKLIETAANEKKGAASELRKLVDALSVEIGNALVEESRTTLNRAGGGG